MPDVNVVRVDAVEEFPGRNDLNVNRLSNGVTCVSNRDEAGGASRYQPGDLVIQVPEGLIAPDWLLQRQGCWNGTKGTLKGSKGNRTCNRTFKVEGGEGIVSEGMLLACRKDGDAWRYELPDGPVEVVFGQDMKAAIGLTDHVG